MESFLFCSFVLSTGWENGDMCLLSCPWRSAPAALINKGIINKGIWERLCLIYTKHCTVRATAPSNNVAFLLHELGNREWGEDHRFICVSCDEPFLNMLTPRFQIYNPFGIETSCYTIIFIMSSEPMRPMMMLSPVPCHGPAHDPAPVASRPWHTPNAPQPHGPMAPRLHRSARFSS